MQCPLCIDEALEPRFHGRVEIDVCPRCRGVWLDRGELDKLADPAPVAASRVPDPGRSPYADDRPDDRPHGKKGKKKRRKSLGERLGDVLEDVLDFD